MLSACLKGENRLAGYGYRMAFGSEVEQLARLGTPVREVSEN